MSLEGDLRGGQRKPTHDEHNKQNNNSTRTLNFLRGFIRKKRKKKEKSRGEKQLVLTWAIFFFFEILFISSQSQQNEDFKWVLQFLLIERAHEDRMRMSCLLVCPVIHPSNIYIDYVQTEIFTCKWIRPTDGCSHVPSIVLGLEGDKWTRQSSPSPVEVALQWGGQAIIRAQTNMLE